MTKPPNHKCNSPPLATFEEEKRGKGCLLHPGSHGALLFFQVYRCQHGLGMEWVMLERGHSGMKKKKWWYKFTTEF